MLLGCLFYQGAYKEVSCVNLVQNPCSCSDFWLTSQSHPTSNHATCLCNTSDAQPRPADSVAAPTNRDCINVRWGHTKTSRGRPNSSHVRQTPRSCLIRHLPAPSHLRIQRQLCTQHAARWAAPLHPRIGIVFKRRRVARKQAAAKQTANTRGKSFGCA